MRQTEDFPRSLNSYLDKYDLKDSDIDNILALRDSEYSSKQEQQKEKLRSKIRKLRKIQDNNYIL